ncbi:MAG: tRNA (adenosine(37)-N6)-dimethylallyltransferase MiaA [Ignavibacteriales bacterium]|nr:tRNA (adenosine(37)-N6)-dimethylallyltransferase MiaA [Ignavibacteriales bacterium]
MDFVTILGPTATGKTKLAAELAYHFNGEIISADSRQVYRSMNIGTGKDYEDYLVETVKIPYHLVDVCEPTDDFSLFDFQKLFYKTFDDIASRQKLPFLAGGTGLYLSSILQNYKLKKAEFNSKLKSELEHKSIDELRQLLLTTSGNLHNTTDLIDKERIIKAIIINQSDDEPLLRSEKLSSLVIGIAPSRSEVKNRITNRLKKRLGEGMIDEVKNLLEKGITPERLNYFGLEYRCISLYLTGELSFNDMFQKLNSAIHNFAKRQMTWFRKMEREGVRINWFEEPDFAKTKNLVEQFFPVIKT